MEEIERQRFSGGYRIFWSIYWLFTLCFLVINYRAVLGTEEEGRGQGGLLFFVFLAVILFSMWRTAFVMRPRRRRDKNGKEIKLRFRPYHLLAFAAADTWCFLIMELVNNELFSEMAFGYRMLNILGIFIINMILFFWMKLIQFRFIKKHSIKLRLI